MQLSTDDAILGRLGESTTTTRNVIAIFVLCLLVFLVNGRPHPEVDCVAAPYVAWSIVTGGSYELQVYEDIKQYYGGPILKREDGAVVSMRPPGSAIAAIPIILPFALTMERPFGAHDMHHIGKLVAVICVAISTVFLFLIIKCLAPSAAWPTTILFAFGTCLWSVASQSLWMHGPAVMGLCGGMYCLICPGRGKMGYCWLAGLAFGFAVLARPTTAIFVVVTLMNFSFQRRWKTCLWISLGGILPAIVLLHYQWSNFGSPLLGGYKNDNWGNPTPLWLGLSGLLFAPSRGLFVYSPALIVSFVGGWSLVRTNNPVWKPHRSLLLAWVAASIITLVFFARWHDWQGGWCYGPRVLCETLPMLCLLFAIAYAGIEPLRSARKYALKTLIGLSVLVHAIGVFGYKGYEPWQNRHALNDQGRSLFSLSDTQIEAHATAFISKLQGKSANRRK